MTDRLNGESSDLPDDVRDAIIDVLCGQSLADHLGDVRDEERTLWRLLGAPDLLSSDPAYYSDSAWRQTKARLLAAGLALPEHLRGSDEDDDDA